MAGASPRWALRGTLERHTRGGGCPQGTTQHRAAPTHLDLHVRHLGLGGFFEAKLDLAGKDLVGGAQSRLRCLPATAAAAAAGTEATTAGTEATAATAATVPAAAAATAAAATVGPVTLLLLLLLLLPQVRPGTAAATAAAALPPAALLRAAMLPSPLRTVRGRREGHT